MRISILLFVLLALVIPADGMAVLARDKGTAYQAGFVKWRAADNGFSDWTLTGALRTSAGALQLDPGSAVDESDPYGLGGYYGGNYYNGGSFLVGEAVGPAVEPAFAFTEAIASWNADTPAGTWIETQIRAEIAGRWTKWYSLGIWTSENEGTVLRHSVRLQGDADGFVSVDTLVISSKEPTQAFQLKLRLFSADGIASPTVRNASVAYSTTPAKKASVSDGDPALWGQELSVPQCSQMVYLDGGNVWCSPTSTSMVLGYWGYMPGECEPRVRDAVAGVDDWIYGGHGNWPFNTAYAASLTLGTSAMEGYVARFTSLAQAETWIDKGVPVVMSVAWKKGELTNATVSSTSGHLIVLIGFDATGNAIVNDPAADSNGPAVRRVYLRSELEPLWLQASGGTVYLIYPAGWDIPQ